MAPNHQLQVASLVVQHDESAGRTLGFRRDTLTMPTIGLRVDARGVTLPGIWLDLSFRFKRKADAQDDLLFRFR